MDIRHNTAVILDINSTKEMYSLTSVLDMHIFVALVANHSKHSLW